MISRAPLLIEANRVARGWNSTSQGDTPTQSDVFEKTSPSEADRILARFRSKQGTPDNRASTQTRDDPTGKGAEHLKKLRAWRRQSDTEHFRGHGSPGDKHALEMAVARAQYRAQQAHSKASKAGLIRGSTAAAHALHVLQRDHPAPKGEGWPGPIQRMRAALPFFKQTQPPKEGKRPPVYLLRKKGGDPNNPDHHVNTVHPAGSPGFEDHEQVHMVEWLLRLGGFLVEAEEDPNESWESVKHHFPGVESPLFHKTRGPRASQIMSGDAPGIHADQDSTFGADRARQQSISLTRSLDWALQPHISGNHTFVMDRGDFHPKHLKPYQHRSAGNEYEERLHQPHVPLKKIKGMVINYPIPKFEADHLRERAPFPVVARHRKTGEWHRI